MAFDTFIYFGKGGVGGEVTGETTDKVYASKKAFEVYSFSFGASNPVTIGSGTTGTGAGKVSISSFNIMKKTDLASTQLFHACASGEHFTEMHVVLRKAGGKQVEYLKYDFTEVYVESIQWSGSSGGDDTPTESVSFAFASMQITYFQQKSDGTLETTPKTAAWDLTLNSNDVK